MENLNPNAKEERKKETDNLNLDQNGRPRWTPKTILIGRTAGVISSFLLFAFPIMLLCQLLVSWVPILRSLNDLLFLAAAAAAAIFWQIRVGNRRLDKLSPEDAVHSFEMECKLKWHPLYGVVILVAVWWVLSNTIYWFLPNSVRNGEWFTMAMLIGLVAACLLAKLFNRFMIRKTRTNAQLLDEMEQGMHWEKIPEDLFNEKDVKKIMKILNKCQAYTVEDAVAIYRRNLSLKKAGKVYGLCMIGAMVVGAFIGNALGGKGTAGREIADEIMNSGIKVDASAQERRRKYDDALAMGRAELNWAKKGVPGTLYTQERLNAAKYWANEARRYRG